MEKYFSILKKNPLFAGMGDELESILACMKAKVMKYQKGKIIIEEGEKVDRIGLVLSGKIKIVREDANGNVSILTEMAQGEMFGEAFACAGGVPSLVSVVASTNMEVMYLAYGQITSTCASDCSHHKLLIENLLKIIARKNIMLNQKIEIVSKKTIREKMMAYLEQEYIKMNVKNFDIAFNREELAYYLCVDRSALSRELSKMQEEGIIIFNKNSFVLNNKFFRATQ